MTEPQIRIKASRTPYQRAGFAFNSASWTELEAASVSREQVGKLLADGNLTIQVREGESEWRALTAEERGLAASPSLVQSDDAGEREDLQDEIDLLRDRLAASEGLVAELQEGLAASTAGLVSRDNRIAELERQAGVAAEDLAARDSRVSDLKAQVDQLTQDLAAADARGSTNTAADQSADETAAGGNAPAGGRKKKDANAPQS